MDKKKKKNSPESETDQGNRHKNSFGEPESDFFNGYLVLRFFWFIENSRKKITQQLQLCFHARTPKNFK